MKKVLLFAFALMAVSAVSAQDLNPVTWTYQAEKVAEGEYDLVFVAHIDDGWYVYSQYLESDEGPIPTSFTFKENGAVAKVGKTTEGGAKHEGYDEVFAMNLIKYSGNPKFTQRVKVSGATELTGYLEYMTCDKTKCLPPMEVEFSFSLK